jgi:hypothetical protein
MEVIKLQGTDDTPSVILDKANGIFEFSGRSLPEDVNAFYEPILEWLSDYCEDHNSSTTVTFKLVYFNTASSKLILDILLKFEEIGEAGSDVQINWYYPEDDEDMEEAGDEYSDIVEIPIKKIPYTL